MTTPNRFVARSAFVAMLAYVMVMLTCAAEAKHLPSFGAQSEATTVRSESQGRGGGEELCQFMHEQLFTKQAFSAGSITVPRNFYAVLIGEELLCQIADSNGFKPPGSGFAPIENLSFRLYSVLRI